MRSHPTGPTQKGATQKGETVPHKLDVSDRPLHLGITPSSCDLCECYYTGATAFGAYPMVLQVKRRQFTLEQYHQMIEAGVLAEGGRVELIDGEILEMAAIGSRHSAQVNRLNRLFSNIFKADDLLVSVQNPVELGPRSEPEPDVVLLRWQADYYESGHPQATDVYLVVEVSDSTVDYDRDVKAPLYAKSGIVEYWLVNLTTEAIEVFRHPTVNGYQSVALKGRGDSIALSTLTNLTLSVDQLLG
jgi:Uma2 family endonuclease